MRIFVDPEFVNEVDVERQLRDLLFIHQRSTMLPSSNILSPIIKNFSSKFGLLSKIE